MSRICTRNSTPAGTRANALRAARGPISSLALATALVVLLVAGVGHRYLLGAIEGAMGELVSPLHPLASVPLQLGDWHGRDVPLDERILRVKQFDDDFVSRVYVHPENRARVGFFIGYQGRPRAWFGHRPDICFPAHGWEPDGREPVSIPTPTGQRVPGIVYEFHRPAADASPRLVLATYMINGQFVEDPGPKSVYTTRSAFGERPAYLTRIELSIDRGVNRAADLERLLELAGEAIEPLKALMPYWDGNAENAQK